jgi:ATP-dependent DNA ligase
VLAVKDGSRVRLLCRRGVRDGRTVPGIVAALAALPAPSLILDGEVAVFDELSSRTWPHGACRARKASDAPDMIVFDRHLSADSTHRRCTLAGNDDGAGSS